MANGKEENQQHNEAQKAGSEASFINCLEHAFAEQMGMTTSAEDKGFSNGVANQPKK